MIGVFQVRRLPQFVCRIHGRVAVWSEDGTERWHCRECVDDALYRAEIVADHRAGRCTKYAVCPFCEPEDAA